MKPCSRNRRKIALLTVDALGAAEEQALRTHLETCPACHVYWQQMLAVSGKLLAAQPRAGIEASERFHQQVARAVRNEVKISSFLSVWHSLAWRLALPFAGICAVAIVLLAPRWWRRPPAFELPAILPARPAVPSGLEPTLSNYQMVANASLDKLDELLISQGSQNPPPVPQFSIVHSAGVGALE